MVRTQSPSSLIHERSDVTYKAYKSPYGPSTKPPFNLHGIDLKQASRLGFALGSFGVAAGVFAIFFFGDVPRVRKDILVKVPMIGGLFQRQIPPEDNPF